MLIFVGTTRDVLRKEGRIWTGALIGYNVNVVGTTTDSVRVFKRFR